MTPPRATHSALVKRSGIIPVVQVFLFYRGGWWFNAVTSARELPISIPEQLHTWCRGEPGAAGPASGDAGPATTTGKVV